MDVATISALSTLMGGSPGVALCVCLAFAVYWLSKQNEKIRERSDKLTDQIAQERTELQATVKRLTELLAESGKADAPQQAQKGEHTA